jgi:alpha-ribazole phosphatase
MGAVTRWWWVRHAPVPLGLGRMMGRTDLPADLGDREAIAALAGALPTGAQLLVSPRERCRLTADGLVAAGFRPGRRRIEPALAEQDFGEWDGGTYDELAAQAGEAYWRLFDDPVAGRPPGGERFLDVLDRIRGLLAAPPGDEIVCVAHAGPVRAALALARGLAPADALAQEVPPLSLHVLTVDRSAR